MCLFPYVEDQTRLHNRSGSIGVPSKSANSNGVRVCLGEDKEMVNWIGLNLRTVRKDKEMIN